MPTPPEGPTSDVEDMGAESSGGREDVATGDGTPHAGTPRWTDEDWRRWNAGTWSWDQGRDGLPSTGTASAPDEGQSTSGHGGNQARRSSTTQSDPWSQPWRDPWANSHGGSQKDETLEERGSGGSDKIVVPDFSGEEDRGQRLPEEDRGLAACHALEGQQAGLGALQQPHWEGMA